MALCYSIGVSPGEWDMLNRLVNMVQDLVNCTVNNTDDTHSIGCAPYLLNCLMNRVVNSVNRTY